MRKSDAEHLNCLDPLCGRDNIINLYQTSTYRRSWGRKEQNDTENCTWMLFKNCANTIIESKLLQSAAVLMKHKPVNDLNYFHPLHLIKEYKVQKPNELKQIFVFLLKHWSLTFEPNKWLKDWHHWVNKPYVTLQRGERQTGALHLALLLYPEQLARFVASASFHGAVSNTARTDLWSSNFLTRKLGHWSSL